jgi:acetyl esterase
MNWQDWTADALSVERLLREQNGAVAADAAPRMAQETRVEIAGMSALKCIPAECTHTVPHVFVHGGGWVFGSSVASLGLIRRIAAQTSRPVVSLDYPLSPEHPYPRAIDTVTRTLEEMAQTTGVAGIIAGSAGSQIALHAVSSARGTRPRAGLLFCGAFGQSLDTWSHIAFGDGSAQLGTQDMQRFLTAYAMPQSAPQPDLANVPPLFLSIGDCDPLLQDSLQVHAAAQHHNGSVLEVVPNARHGFMNDWYKNPRIDRAVTDALDWLEKACAVVD